MHVACDGVAVRGADRWILRSTSLEAHPGVLTVVSGPSGSGKTTLLGVLGGLVRPETGAISFDGTQVTARVRRSSVAWTPQGANSLPGRSVLHNVEVAAQLAGQTKKLARSESRRLLSQVGLDAKERQRARTLSGGELQRLALARAVATRRPIVLADEPTSNLDRASATRVAEVIAELSSEGRTVIVATHDPAIVTLADVVVDLSGEASAT